MSPHAESVKATNGTHYSTTMSDMTTNGEKPSSQFISHLTSYPVISDTLSTVSSTPYGAKSISLFNSAYSTAYSNIYPRVSPYLATPYSYIAPYLAKADSLGDSGLSTLDSKFPIVREQTSTLQEKAKGYYGYPFTVYGKGKNFVLATYNDEYEKSRGGMIVKTGKAVLGTEIKVGMKVVEVLRGFLGQVKSEGEKKIKST